MFFLLGLINPLWLRSELSWSKFLLWLRFGTEAAASTTNPATTPRQQQLCLAWATPTTNRAKPPSIRSCVQQPLCIYSWMGIVVSGWRLTVQHSSMFLVLAHTTNHRKQLPTTLALPLWNWAMPPPILFGVLMAYCIYGRMSLVVNEWAVLWIGLWTQTGCWAPMLNWIGNHCTLSFGLVPLFLVFITAANFLCYLLLVHRQCWRNRSHTCSIIHFTISGTKAPLLVLLADFVQALGGYYFLSRYYQDPNIADMIHHSITHTIHYFTAAHLLSAYFYEGLLGHLLKVHVTSPLEYGRESAGLSTTILFCYFGYIGSLVPFEWPSFLHGLYCLIGVAIVVVSGGHELPSHFYHICYLRYLFAASAPFLDFGITPKDFWFCIVLVYRVDFLTLSSLVEPSWKLIFLLY